MKKQRICIIGNSGSGKSTLANKIGKSLNMPVYHLDKYMCHGDFQELPHETRLKVHSELVKGDDWIIEGNFRRYLDERLSRATLVIFLSIPRYLVLYNALKRTVGNNYPNGSAPENANTKKFTPWLFGQILKYSRREKLKVLKNDIRQFPGVSLLVLKPDSLESWVKQVGEIVSDVSS